MFYEYDIDGWLIGWHTDAARASSTPVPHTGIPPNRARWNGAAWISDTTREVKATADAFADTTNRARINRVMASFDPINSTAADTRATLAAVIAYLTKTS